MSNKQKKTIEEKKQLGRTPGGILSNRGTFGGTTRKILSRSRSFTSVSSSSSILSTLSEGSKSINPLEKEIEIYEEEYCTYMISLLKSKLLQEDRGKMEEVKKCLVSLKREYEDVVGENSVLQENLSSMEILSESCLKLGDNLLKAQKLLKVLKETKFDDVLKGIISTLEEDVNTLKLIDLKREDINDAFSKNLIGFNSDMYELLKMMEEHAGNHKVLLPEIVEKVKEIQLLHEENQDLKMRCTARADQLRRQTVVSNYEKYFKMAVEECRDILELLPEDRIANFLVDESLSQRTIYWGDPVSSSTPTTHTMPNLSLNNTL